MSQGGRVGRLVSIWITPPLLLAVPTVLLAHGRDGLWLALLFLIAPLFAFLASASPRATESPAGAETPFLVAMLLSLGLLLWANLSLAGDVAAWMGLPRWRGVVPVAGLALALVLLPGPSRRARWLIPAGLVALLVPVGVMVHVSPSNPIATWTQVASQPAFRFPAGSPWVTEGRPVGHRRGSLALRFEEEHRVTPLDSDPLRVEVSDQGRVQIQEWTLSPGQSVTLRPGDRLQVDRPRRLKFEADKRIPGAPVSGIAWADSTGALDPLPWLRLLGLGLTLLAGAVGLAGRAGSPGTTRAGVAAGSLALLAALAWGECWAVYAARWAPEFFLGGVSAAGLLELPALVLRGTPWGAPLVGLTLVGLLALFLAGSVALREQGLPGEEDPGLWIGIFAVAALAALWPLEPWSLALLGLGLAASTLGLPALMGTPAGEQGAGAVGVWIGLGVFAAMTALGRVWVPSGPVAEALLAYPALVAAPVAAVSLRVARRASRA